MVSCIRYHGSMWSGYFRLVKKIFSSNQILCILEVIVFLLAEYRQSDKVKRTTHPEVQNDNIFVAYVKIIRVI